MSRSALAINFKNGVTGIYFSYLSGVIFLLGDVAALGVFVYIKRNKDKNKCWLSFPHVHDESLVCVTEQA